MTGENTGPYGGYIYSHNVSGTRTPARLKVRWHVRVAAGAEAKRLDEIQQKAILALLAWADRHPDAYQPPNGDAAENTTG